MLQYSLNKWFEKAFFYLLFCPCITSRPAVHVQSPSFSCCLPVLLFSVKLHISLGHSVSLGMVIHLSRLMINNVAMTHSTDL